MSGWLPNFLTVSPDTVYDVFKRGELPGRKVGRKWITTRNAVLRWIESSLETMIKRPLYINAASHVYTGYHIKTYRIVHSPASHAIFAKDTLDRQSHTRYAALQ